MAGYTDDELAAAVAAARSWRGVLRLLGRPAHSAGALRSARSRASALGLDCRHFTGQRRWTDQQLSAAVPASTSWSEVLDRLGLASSSGSARASLRSHAARLGLEVGHLESGTPANSGSPFSTTAGPRHLDRAGALLAAAWFALHGYDVAWPLEPARYDLLVTDTSGTYRIQVKTTTSRSGGAWAVRISSNRRHGTVVYTPDEVDYFFVIDGELTCYLIPLAVVGGYQVIRLRRYLSFALPRWLAADSLSGLASPAPAPRSRSASR